MDLNDFFVASDYSSSDSDSDCSTSSESSTLTLYEDLYPLPEEEDGTEVVDLTALPDDDDYACDDESFATNCGLMLEDAPTIIAKFTVRKQVRESKLKRMDPPLAEHIHFSLFSSKSKQHYIRLKKSAMETFVADSINPFFYKALFAGQFIPAGSFIMLYEGWRMAEKESEARKKRGRCSNYILNITMGVVVDALGFSNGAGMSNHSCRPNARLRHGYLCGREHAPYGYLQALKDIQVGEEIECDYHQLMGMHPERIKELLQSGNYVPCRCLKPSCRKSFSHPEDA